MVADVHHAETGVNYQALERSLQDDEAVGLEGVCGQGPGAPLVECAHEEQGQPVDQVGEERVHDLPESTRRFRLISPHFNYIKDRLIDF